MPPKRSMARRRRRLVAAAALLALLGAVAWWYVSDQTRLRPAESVVRSAAERLAAAANFRFHARLGPHQPDAALPETVVEGHFQRNPYLLRLLGTTRAGESPLSMGYFIEEERAYVLEPTTRRWLVFESLEGLDAVLAYRGEDIMAGLVAAAKVESERLPDGPARVIAVTLDGARLGRLAALLPVDAAGVGRIEGRLWVLKRSLLPARLVITVPAIAADGSTKPFEVRIDWTRAGAAGVASVPEEIRKSAVPTLPHD